MAFADKYGPWALITGASAGIGAEFARQIAARGVNVALVARRADKLETLAGEIEATTSVRALPIAADLTRDDFLEVIIEALGVRHVGLLVNNAGNGHTGAFLDHDLEAELDVLALNCRAPLILTHHFGRLMRSEGRGGIVMLSSITGILPTPQFANYSATKAWNRFVGESLHEELRASHVHVVSLCPGLTYSEFFDKVHVDPAVWAAPFRVTIMDTGTVVKAALGGLGHSSQVVPGLGYRMLMRASRMAPSGIPSWMTQQLMRFALPNK